MLAEKLIIKNFVEVVIENMMKSKKEGGSQEKQNETFHRRHTKRSKPRLDRSKDGIERDSNNRTVRKRNNGDKSGPRHQPSSADRYRTRETVPVRGDVPAGSLVHSVPLYEPLRSRNNDSFIKPRGRKGDGGDIERETQLRKAFAECEADGRREPPRNGGLDYHEYCKRSKDVQMPLQNARLAAAIEAMKKRKAMGIDISLAKTNTDINAERWNKKIDA